MLAPDPRSRCDLTPRISQNSTRTDGRREPNHREGNRNDHHTQAVPPVENECTATRPSATRQGRDGPRALRTARRRQFLTVVSTNDRVGIQNASAAVKKCTLKAPALRMMCLVDPIAPTYDAVPWAGNARAHPSQLLRPLGPPLIGHLTASYNIGSRSRSQAQKRPLINHFAAFPRCQRERGRRGRRFEEPRQPTASPEATIILLVQTLLTERRTPVPAGRREPPLPRRTGRGCRVEPRRSCRACIRCRSSCRSAAPGLPS